MSFIEVGIFLIEASYVIRHMQIKNSSTTVLFLLDQPITDIN